MLKMLFLLGACRKSVGWWLPIPSESCQGWRKRKITLRYYQQLIRYAAYV